MINVKYVNAFSDEKQQELKQCIMARYLKFDRECVCDYSRLPQACLCYYGGY